MKGSLPSAMSQENCLPPFKVRREDREQTASLGAVREAEVQSGSPSSLSRHNLSNI